jgi:hypothetical protein
MTPVGLTRIAPPFFLLQVSSPEAGAPARPADRPA